MTLNKKNTWGGVSYETPLVTTLDVLSEGVLCNSYTWTEGGAGTYTDDDIHDNGGY